MFFVPGPLPGQNEIIKAAKSGRGRSNAYSRMKALYTARAVDAIRSANLNPVYAADLRFDWREITTKRDPDNITAGQKFIIDGLVETGVLLDDNWKHICGLAHVWRRVASPGFAGVWVTVKEVS